MKDDLKAILTLGVQGIQFLCFIHQRGWDAIVTNDDPKTMLFRNWISTDKGAQLVKKLILSTIYALKPGEENHKCVISGFLKKECETLAGTTPLLFYQVRITGLYLAHHLCTYVFTNREWSIFKMLKMDSNKN